MVLADLVVELSEAMPFGMPIIGGTFETGAELAVITHDMPQSREAFGAPEVTGCHAGCRSGDRSSNANPDRDLRKLRT